MNIMNGLKILTLAGLIMGASPLTAQVTQEIGIVDFRRCLDDSKFGQKERDGLLALQKQLATQVEAAEQELNHLTDKLRDPEFLDSLSSEAEEELKMRYQALSQDIVQRQNQFYQIMGQGEMKLMQQLTTQIMRAAQIVAKEKKLEYVIREDAFAFFNPTHDVTKDVVSEMDKLFISESGESVKQ